MHPFFQDFNFYGFVHRGGDEVETENTYEAFKYSSDLGFIFMETDVQITKDGHVVIFHDADLRRMAGVSKKIHELNLNEVSSIELKDGGKIPLLSSILESFPNLRFNIDIKVEDAVDSTVEIIKKMNRLDSTCLASFSSKRLDKIRALAGPKACTSSGQMEIFNLICRSIGITTRKTNSDCAQIPKSQWGIPILTRRFITKAHQEGKLVHIWTIDDENEMYKLIDFGIDGLMTDKPSVLKKALQLKGLF